MMSSWNRFLSLVLSSLSERLTPSLNFITLFFLLLLLLVVICFILYYFVLFLCFSVNGLKSAGAAALQTVVSANWLTLQSASPPPPLTLSG